MFCFYPRQSIKKTGVSKNCGSKDYGFGHRVKKVNYLSKQPVDSTCWIDGFSKTRRWISHWKKLWVKQTRSSSEDFFGTEKFGVSIRHSPSWHLSSVKGLDSKSSFLVDVCCLFFQKVGRHGIGKIKVTRLFSVIFGLARWKWESYSYLNKSTYIYIYIKNI